VEKRGNVNKGNMLVYHDNIKCINLVAIVPSPDSNPAPGQLFPTSANEEQWVCPQCTLKNNPTNQVCEACQLPRTQ